MIMFCVIGEKDQRRPQAQSSLIQFSLPSPTFQNMFATRCRPQTDRPRTDDRQSCSFSSTPSYHRPTWRCSGLLSPFHVSLASTGFCLMIIRVSKGNLQHPYVQRRFLSRVVPPTSFTATVWKIIGRSEADSWQVDAMHLPWGSGRAHTRCPRLVLRKMAWVDAAYSSLRV
ncbi:hypothetical protein EV126DRAFT_131425 [Verticillium dahliae]|nr:hypothetical protein EV126DRAFT_161924 [Verticillium dahliae]KAH6687674.1 hypothetical protein EV126DRAFT_131425 [Verticillium dahliae]